MSRMAEFPEDAKPQEKKPPERPLECSECKKELAVRYTEVEKGQFHETIMCNDCPELQKKLRGISINPIDGEGITSGGLACGECGTSLEELRVGHPVGCSHCYEVFDTTITYELFSSRKIPNKIDTEKKSALIHQGRSPGEALEVNPSLRLVALNEALDETLKQEDYEQAAMIRDQINALTETNENEEDSDKNGKEQ